MNKKQSPQSLYQIRVTLLGISPPIWRQVLVPRHVNLRRLHEILLVVMGWQGSHLYQFRVEGDYIGEPDPDFDFDMQHAERAALSDLYHGSGTKFVYEYDLGDNWEHEVVMEEVVTPEPDQFYPVCLAGERASPPDDCGGVWGYEDLLEVLNNPDHPDYAEMLQWVGEEFDPEAFDVSRINDELKAMS